MVFCQGGSSKSQRHEGQKGLLAVILRVFVVEDVLASNIDEEQLAKSRTHWLHDTQFELQ
jgi:hypothetical protein